MRTPITAGHSPHRRWLAVAAVQLLLLVLLITDALPWLRGYAPWPPEWRWLHQPSWNVPGLASMVFFGLAIGALGRWAGVARGWPLRAAQVGALLLGTLAWQLSAVWVRGEDPGLLLAQRTTVPFLEDFFQAAQVLDDPSEAFSRYDWLASEHNRLRVATHPPGLIYAYRLLISAGEASDGPPWLAGAADGIFGGEHHAAQLTDPELAALLLGTGLKLAGGLLAVVAAMLLVYTLHPGRDRWVPALRLGCLVALIPALTLFTATLDQLALGLSTLAIAAFLVSVHRHGSFGWAALAGGAIFLQSLLVHQAAVTGLICIVAGSLLAVQRLDPAILGQNAAVRREARDAIILRSFAAFLALPAVLWGLLWLSTGYLLPREFLEGLSAHRDFPIHTSRSRLAWLFWNPWDVFFFAGVAWLGCWARGATWRSLPRNPLLIALGLTWLLITLGDGIRGETARLMLFVYPLIAAGLAVAGGGALGRREYAWLAGLLLVQSIVFAAVFHLF